MLCQQPGPRSEGTTVATSIPRTCVLVSNDILQKKEPVLPGEVAESRAGQEARKG